MGLSGTNDTDDVTRPERCRQAGRAATRLLATGTWDHSGNLTVDSLQMLLVYVIRQAIRMCMCL
jgi:hypothetical protein